MSASQRNKGASGEREVARILREGLKLDIARNWKAQSVGRLYDIEGVPGWAIEVKRSQLNSKRIWWKQAVAQAQRTKLLPALIYRIDRLGAGLDLEEKWIVMIPIYTVYKQLQDTQAIDMTVEMSIKTWIEILKKELKIYE